MTKQDATDAIVAKIKELEPLIEEAKALKVSVNLNCQPNLVPFTAEQIASGKTNVLYRIKDETPLSSNF